MTQVSASDRLATISQAVIDKLLAVRESDDIGVGDEWADERLATCEDDYTYDLAVEVRKLRAQGTAWWRIAYELELPGCGASAKQGRLGAQLSRRLWRAAWGQTYEAIGAMRETKDDKVVRALADRARPYFAGDAPETFIIGKLAGARIEWVVRLEAKGGLVTSAQETYVHEDERTIRVKLGPKGRYVEFYEMLDRSLIGVQQSIAKSGPLRSVYLDRITKVGA
jgi:hypothetical protein